MFSDEPYERCIPSFILPSHFETLSVSAVLLSFRILRLHASQDKLREKSLSRPKREILLRSLTFVRDDNLMFWKVFQSDS